MRKRTTAAAAAAGAAVLGGSLFVLTQNSADAAPTPAQWSCQGSTSYASSVHSTITAVRGTGSNNKIVTVTVAPATGTGTPAGTVYWSTNAFTSGSPASAYVTAQSATLSSGSATFTFTSANKDKFFAYEPAANSVFCSSATTAAR